MKFLFLIKTVTFTIFSLIYLYNQDENLIRNCLEYGKKLNMSLDLRPYRLLAKYEEQNELMNARIQYKTNDNRQHHKLTSGRDNNTYENLKREKPNNMESYLNSYKSRYSKKSGLKKLDCYYEKKLFSRMNKIEKIAKEKNFKDIQVQDLNAFIISNTIQHHQQTVK
ncbi:Protein of unknown function, putative [Plasmodium vivax]|uniref:VIR protein n=1 Tax=Plasmodium vivax TaxID=5855 RepID=A0A1G4EE21_PLAVI|nr:Protein of unknown function, putative [Plasmodium vivax]